MAAVAYRALFDTSLDGRVLNVTGPPSSTLTAAGMASLLSQKTGTTIKYDEDPIPESEDMAGLWHFLRAGGFDVSISTVKELTCGEELDFGAILDGLARDQLLAVDTPAA